MASIPVTNSVSEWLTEKLPTFTPEHEVYGYLEEAYNDIRARESFLAVPNERKEGSTTRWSSTNLRGVVLSPLQHGWTQRDLPHFKEALDRFNKDWEAPDVPEQLACVYPRTEEDTVAAVESQILHPIRTLATSQGVSDHWLPSPSAIPELSQYDMKWEAELVGEAYTKDKTGAHPGVRVDKLVIMSMRADTDTRGSRSVSEARKLPELSKARSFTNVRSRNRYLDSDQVWGLGDLSEASWPEMVGACKALLPVEIKPYGSLQEHIFAWIAKHELAFTKVTAKDLEPKLRNRKDRPDPNVGITETINAILGTISIIAQTLRYAFYYDAPAVMVTDYKSAIILRLPTATTTKGRRIVEWDFVTQDNLRLAVSTMFYRASQRMKEVIEEKLKASREEKSKAGREEKRKK